MQRSAAGLRIGAAMVLALVASAVAIPSYAEGATRDPNAKLPKPDLVAVGASPKFTPFCAPTSGWFTFPFEVAVKNDGVVTATNVPYTLSAVVGGNAWPAGGVIVSIAPGQTVKQTIMAVYPGTASQVKDAGGTVTYLLRVDEQQQILETNEANNAAYVGLFQPCSSHVSPFPGS